MKVRSDHVERLSAFAKGVYCLGECMRAGDKVPGMSHLMEAVWWGVRDDPFNDAAVAVLCRWFLGERG